MVIRTSSNRETDRLIVDLSSTEATTRDAAVARLTVIGGRAVRRLIALVTDEGTDSVARVAAFRTLEAIGDPRAIKPALDHLADAEPTIAVSAIDVARVFLDSEQGVELVDRLTALAMNREERPGIRSAAVRALSDLDASTVKPLLTAIREDPSIAAATAASSGSGIDLEGPIAAAAGGRLDGSPDQLRRALAESGTEVPVTVLRQLVERLRTLEDAEPAGRQSAWMAVRAAAHSALARQGSRLAMYDLRETFESEDVVAVEFLAAAAMVGDASCLESLAAAYMKAPGAANADDWWRRSLADAFRAIVSREGITRRHAVARKIDKRWAGLFRSLVRN